jgi:MFS family permease
MVSGLQPVVARKAAESLATPSERGFFGIYTGWLNVIIVLVAITFVIGSTNYSFGLFVRPVSEALGLSRATFNIGQMSLMIGTATASPFMGYLLDRQPILWIARASALLFAVTMFAISRTTTIWLFPILLAGPLAISVVGCGGLFGTVIVSRWFTDLRGRALSIMWMGTSFGGMLIVPVNAILLSFLGWQQAIAAIGLIVGVVVIGLTYLLKAEPEPQTSDYLISRDRGHIPGQSWRAILKQRDFWLISLSVSMMLSVDSALLATITPYVLDRGMSLAQAASLMSALTASAIAGKVVIAWISDRADLRLMLAVTALFGIFQTLALTLDLSYGLLLAVSLLTGLAVGGTMPLANIVLSYRFGAASVGTVMGMKMPVTLVLSMGTLYFVGATYDRYGDYNYAFWIFSGMFAASILFLPFIRYRVNSDGAAKISGVEAAA